MLGGFMGGGVGPDGEEVGEEEELSWSRALIVFCDIIWEDTFEAGSDRWAEVRTVDGCSESGWKCGGVSRNPRER